MSLWMYLTNHDFISLSNRKRHALLSDKSFHCHLQSKNNNRVTRTMVEFDQKKKYIDNLGLLHNKNVLQMTIPMIPSASVIDHCIRSNVENDLVRRSSQTFHALFWIQSNNKFFA